MEETKKRRKLVRLAEMDLTTGNLFWKIPLFALPMALTTFLQLFYTTFDLWSVTTFGGGSNSMSAVGSNGALINLIVTVFVSLALGANVVIANARGANNKEKAEKTIHTSLLLAVVAGIGVGIFGFFISRSLLIAMGTSEDILDLATDYLQIYFIGLPFLMVYNYSAQIMRALGSSRKPLYILFAAGLLNCLADWIFVAYFGLDVKGVAWATVLSEALSAVLSIIFLSKGKDSFVRFSFKKLRIDKQCLIEVLKIGLPAGLQGLAFSIPNVLIQSSLYSITNDVIPNHDIVVGSAASNNVEGYIFALLDSVAAACVAFVGQNYGAKKKSNCKKSFWYSQIWTIFFWGVSVAICLPLGRQLLSLFINGSDGSTNVANAIEAGFQRLFVMALFYVLDGFMAVASGYMRGMKFSLTPALIILVGCTITRIIFLLWIFPLPYFHNVTWLYGAFPISWILTDIADLIAVLIIEPKAFKKMELEGSILPKQKGQA